MQLMSNGRFKSVHHRVLANKTGPRISAACFLTPFRKDKRLPCRPIKELLSESNPLSTETSQRETIIITFSVATLSKITPNISSFEIDYNGEYKKPSLIEGGSISTSSINKYLNHSQINM